MTSKKGSNSATVPNGSSNKAESMDAATTSTTSTPPSRDTIPPSHLQQIVGFLLYHPEEGHHVGVRYSATADRLRQGLTPEHATEKVLHSVLFSQRLPQHIGNVKTWNDSMK